MTIPTHTTREALGLLEHRDTCGRPQMRTDTDPSGRIITRCTSCGSRLWHDVPAPAARPTQVAAPVVFVSSWRCRDHLEPVTWKGSGCRSCASEDRDRRRAARKIARARAQTQRIDWRNDTDE